LWKTDGFSAAVKALYDFIKHRPISDYVIDRRRRQLSSEVDSLFHSTVAYGPFKGLTFCSTESMWGIDRASMLLGLYEQEILQSLTSIPGKDKTLIVLGAADGYYAIGGLVSGLFEYCWAFEASEAARDILARNAALNGVSGKISILGRATGEFFKPIKLDGASKTVMIVDVEGGEFELFNKDVFRIFKDAIIFMELHDDTGDKLAKLRNDASAYFDITELTMTSRDVSRFAELKTYSDTDRWLICSEGRPVLMSWYRFDPKSPQPASGKT
jgi:hypothetical protein